VVTLNTISAKTVRDISRADYLQVVMGIISCAWTSTKSTA